MAHGGWVYIFTNRFRTALYTGVTSDLLYRLWQHRETVFPKSHSAHYKTTVLVYFEFYESIEAAIAREKQIKNWSRWKKDRLINELNPGWEDLTYRL